MEFFHITIQGGAWCCFYPAMLRRIKGYSLQILHLKTELNKKTLAFCPPVSNRTDSCWFWTAVGLTAAPLRSPFFHFSARLNCRVSREARACLGGAPPPDSGAKVRVRVHVRARMCSGTCIVNVYLSRLLKHIRPNLTGRGQTAMLQNSDHLNAQRPA